MIPDRTEAGDSIVAEMEKYRVRTERFFRSYEDIATRTLTTGGDHPTSPRIHVVSALGGLGNQMLASLTGLIYAAMSGRVLVIQTESPYGDLYQQRYGSLRVGDILERSDVTNEVKDTLREAESRLKASNSYGILGNFAGGTVPSLPEAFYCHDFNQSWEGSLDLLVTKSFNFDGSLITRNERYQKKWQEIFGPETNIAGAFLARYFSPSRQVEDLLRTIPIPFLPYHPSYQSHRSSTFTVGFQIRGKDWFPGKGEGLTFWIECARLLHQQQQVSGSKGLRDLHIHVATDVKENMPALQDAFGAASVSFLEPSQLAGPSGVLLEVLTLAHCDALVLTEGSTFGYIIAMYYEEMMKNYARGPPLIYRTIAYRNDLAKTTASFPELKSLIEEQDRCIAVTAEPCSHQFKEYRTNPPSCMTDEQQRTFKEYYKSDAFPSC